MLRRILTSLCILFFFAACKEDAAKQNNPSPGMTQNGTPLTYDQLNMQKTSAENAAASCQTQLLQMQTQNMALRNQITAMGQTPNDAGVVNNGGLLGGNNIGSLLQLALGFLNKPTANGSCGPSGNNCCTANVFQQCVQGTNYSIYCNATGTAFESRQVSGQCGF